MEAEEFITLLDSYWFGQPIFKKNNSSSPSKPHIFSQSTIHKRSQSDQMMNNNSSIANSIISDDSQNSVLYSSPPPPSQKKQTSPTTTTTRRRSESRNSPKWPLEAQGVIRTPKPLKKKMKKKPLSKSLSELEFEEVKGFMDLGFVFSEEDKETSLVEIIPGLQRIIGKEKNTNRGAEEEKETSDNNNNNNNNVMISRPYLSEAWDDDDLDGREEEEKKNPLMNWRIPNGVINDEIDMKDNLKWWAQAVASTVIR